MLDNTGKIAIVTGQSRGLGAAIGYIFKKAGYTVPACTRHELNVSDPASVKQFCANIGAVDVLVNNAAILGPVGLVERNQDWHETLLTNLMGPVWLTQAVLPGMKKRGGKIINIAGGGATGPLPRRSAYAASKAALVRFTETVAEEVKDFGIEVNAVLPGPLKTDMLDQIVASGENVETPDEDAIDRAASLCLWLAQTDGLTGRTLSARFDPWPFDDAEKKRIMASDLYTLRRIDKEA